ncbi:MAG: helix-turn-helix domain-containing protein [Devosia sp.]
MSKPEIIHGLPDIAEEIGVSVPTLKAMIDRGEFPIVENEVGRFCIRRVMLDAWWAEREKQARLEALKRTQRLRSGAAA